MHQNRHQVFRGLHKRGQPFVLCNVWDAGGARMAQALGARAVATSSAALAFTLGKTDGTLTREEALRHAADIVAAVDIPVSADLENGYGETPAEVARTIALAAQAGLSGASVEDTALPAARPYPFEVAVERVRAAAAAARAAAEEFVLVARADGVMTGAYDATEAARRLAAFEAAGADCLYAPMLSFADTAALCAWTALPVNVLIAGENTARAKSEFAAIGAARLSLGSSLARAVHLTMHDALRAMLQEGDFSALGRALDGAVADKLIARG